jgi:hypothetical protein
MKVSLFRLSHPTFDLQNAIDEKTRKAQEHLAFLVRIAKECSEEIGFELEKGMKLIRGDFSDRTEKAQVNICCSLGKTIKLLKIFEFSVLPKMFLRQRR